MELEFKGLNSLIYRELHKLMPKQKIQIYNGLTQKQELFCQEYVRTGNAFEAYKKAGYESKVKPSLTVQTNRLLNNAKVQARLKELNEMNASNAVADAQEIKEKLTAIIRQSCDEEVLMSVLRGDRSEVEKHKKKNDVRCALKALELLGKMGGMFTENYQISGGVQVQIKDDLE